MNETELKELQKSLEKDVFDLDVEYDPSHIGFYEELNYIWEIVLSNNLVSLIKR